VTTVISSNPSEYENLSSSILDQYTTALHDAIRQASKPGADPNHHRLTIVNAKNAGADIALPNEFGWNALHLASHTGSRTIFRAVAQGYAVDSEDFRAWVNTCVGQRFKRGSSILHLAAEVNAAKLGKELIEKYKVDPTIRDWNQIDAYTLAERGNKMEFAAMMRTFLDR
jgi:ankyrin repeat protein